MPWDFAATIRLDQLPSIGPFKLKKSVEPVMVVGGKFRVRLIAKSKKEYQFVSYEGTIGNMMEAGGLDGWIEAYPVTVKGPTGEKTYTNFRTVKP